LPYFSALRKPILKELLNFAKIFRAKPQGIFRNPQISLSGAVIIRRAAAKALAAKAIIARETDMTARLKVLK